MCATTPQQHKGHHSITKDTTASQRTPQHHKGHHSITKDTTAPQGTPQHHKGHHSTTRDTTAPQGTPQHHKGHHSITKTPQHHEGHHGTIRDTTAPPRHQKGHRRTTYHLCHTQSLQMTYPDSCWTTRTGIPGFPCHLHPTWQSQRRDISDHWCTTSSCKGIGKCERGIQLN